MDFVQSLINDGYNEEEIGDILECLYIVDSIDSENLNEEVLLEKNLKLAAIETTIKALKKMPMNSWIKKQLARLRLARANTNRSIAANAAKPPKGATPTPTPAPKPKPKSNKSAMSNLVKGALVTGGALTYSALNDGGAGTTGDSGSATTQQTTDDKTSNGTPSTTAPQPKGKFWWDTLKPKQLPYQSNPGLRAYRNVG